MKELNIAGVTGFWLCFCAIIFGIVTNGGLQTIMNFIHIPSLIVTLGGSMFAVLANWICIPVARKLEKSSEQERLVMEVIIEGMLSVQAGENSRIIKEKFKSILADDMEEAA